LEQVSNIRVWGTVPSPDPPLPADAMDGLDGTHLCSLHDQSAATERNPDLEHLSGKTLAVYMDGGARTANRRFAGSDATLQW